MDQAASEDQIILRDIRKCSEDSDMDSHFSVCVDSYHQKETAPWNRTLYNITDTKPHAIRKNTIGSITYDI